MTSKPRLDQLLTDRRLADNRSHAQALIMAGKVFSGERRLDKPGMAVAADSPLEVRGKAHPGRVAKLPFVEHRYFKR